MSSINRIRVLSCFPEDENEIQFQLQGERYQAHAGDVK